MAFFNAAALVLHRNENFVLVRENRSAKAGFYNLPAGTLEVHEDIISCVLREAREETGILDLRLEAFVGVYEIVTDDGNNILLSVFAGSADPSASLGSVQHSDVREFSYRDLLELDRSGQLRSPVVAQAVSDFRDGQRFPLSAVRTWKLRRLDSVTVDKPSVVG
jgi:8-oxo-dGTP pyrophosphatase MutT (NUDIX family)